MERFQAWFDRIVGFSSEERRRLAFAEQVFGQYRIDTTQFERPACWRRIRRSAVPGFHRI